MSRYLGIDYGDKRIGIAISDEDGKFAFPKLVISGEPARTERGSARSGGWRVASKEIKELILKENIRTIVVGLPQNFKGEDTRQTQKVRVFAERLKKELGIEIIFENELLTTKEVEKNFAAPKHMADASSAALILQQYLDRHRIGV